MTVRFISEGPIQEAQFAFDGTIAVAVGDLMFHDTNDVKPASSQADGGSEALNQAAFAPLFAGLARDARTVSETTAVTAFPVATDVVVEMPCASDTYEVGDRVTVLESAGGIALENQKLTKTTDETLAIGYALKRYGSATTTVLVRLVSRVLPHNPSPDSTAQLTSATLPVLIFNGATGINEIRIPTNLADALSLESSAGDILVIDTTTGAVAVTLTTSAAAGLTLASHVTMGDAKNIILNATTGTKLGTAVTQKLGFWNATPIVQPVGAAQGALTDNSGGSGTTVPLVGNTMAGNEAANINNGHFAIVTLLHAIRTALVNSGIIKGAA